MALPILELIVSTSVHQFICRIILGFGRNHMKIKTYVSLKIENMLEKVVLAFKGPSIVCQSATYNTTHFARSGYISKTLGVMMTISSI